VADIATIPPEPVVSSWLSNGPICNPYIVGQNADFSAYGSAPAMNGVPTWMAIGGVVLMIVATHFLLAWRRKEKPAATYPRRDLLKVIPGLKTLIKKPFFPILAQSLAIALFALVISAGLFGSTRNNIAPVLTWTWWWVLLVFFVLGFGNIFCVICPWEGLSSLVTSGSLKSRIKRLGFEYKWPKAWRNIFPAIVLFILLTWFELGMNITASPRMTATMGLWFAGFAILTALVFERRAFCRYVCLVGRIQGMYALFSPLELRPDSNDVCRTCTSKACYKGTETTVGCPTQLFPGNLMENTYCTLCTECIRSCPHDNLSINLRPPATDLVRKVRFKMDEAILAVVLLALTSFHGVTMTPYWSRINDLLRAELGWGPKPVFTLLMIAMMLIPAALFWFASGLSSRMAGAKDIDTVKVFKAFALSLIPIALFYHVAHNGMHFFMEAQYIIPLLSDPFGWGWDLFGTAGKTYPPLLSLRSIWWLQIIMIFIGHLYGVVVADRLAHRLFQTRDRRMIFWGLLPLIVMMVLYSAFSVWLVAQPMEMRTGM
jgi:ferredoxin